MTIYVKQKHINNGIRHSPSNCPVALAFKEQTGDACAVNATYISYSSYMKHRVTPASVQKFIKDFDSGLLMSPFSFDIEL